MTLLMIIWLLSVFVSIVSGEECLESDIMHIEWSSLTEEGINIPAFEYEIDFDKFNLEIIIDANLTYLGYSMDKDNNILGTTYILDFESRNAHILPINKPGTCSNRDGNDFIDIPFNEWWGYSINNPPIPPGGDSKYLSYPPGGSDWFIQSINCQTLRYKGHFSYKELYDECTNFDGTEKYSVLSSDDKWINLTLTFYINIVSPLINDEESGFYRVYQLLSAPFIIAIQKTIHILEPIGIRLFTMSVIAVYKENDDNDFRLILVTETAEYLKLDTPKLMTYPWDLKVQNEINFHINNQYNNPCLSNKNYFCSQIWEIYADDVPCPPQNFSGLYGMQFEAMCNDDASDDDIINEQRSDSCIRWKQNYDEIVDLSTNLMWIDEICDAKVWEIHFGGIMRFYDTNNFNLDPVDVTSYLYVVGEDRIYVEIEVLIPSESYNVFKTQLINVWLCTIDPLNDEPVLNIDTGDGGCFVNVDDDGPYHIIQNYNDVLLYNATHHDIDNIDKPSNIVRFSFISPVTIIRDTLYIHAQLTLSLINSDRRRMIDDDNDNDEHGKSNQIKHFIDKLDVDITKSKPYQHFKDIEKHKKENGFYDKPIYNQDENKHFIEKLGNNHKGSVKHNNNNDNNDNNLNLNNNYNDNEDSIQYNQWNEYNQYNGNDNNNDINNNNKKPKGGETYIIINENAYNLLKIVTVIIGFLLFANICSLIYWKLHK